VIFGTIILDYGFREPSSPGPATFLSRLMPFPQTHMRKPKTGRDFMNKSARFLQRQDMYFWALLELVGIKEL
jgi:hypothetical protein